MSEVDRALERHLQVWTVAPEDRALYGHAFRSGWAARTTTTDAVMVTREYLADLERRVTIREKRAFMPRPDGSVS